MSGRRLIGGGLGVISALAIAACGSTATWPAHSATGSHARPVASLQDLPPALSGPPSITLPSGPPPPTLVLRNLITGHGEVAKPGDQVTVRYIGVLYRNGKVFDSSWVNGQPFTTVLANGDAISGLVRGILGERVGGRREVIIPPALGYGASGSPPKIPPRATLIYDIDLVKVAPNPGDD